MLQSRCVDIFSVSIYPGVDLTIHMQVNNLTCDNSATVLEFHATELIIHFQTSFQRPSGFKVNLLPHGPSVGNLTSFRYSFCFFCLVLWVVDEDDLMIRGADVLVVPTVCTMDGIACISHGKRGGEGDSAERIAKVVGQWV